MTTQQAEALARGNELRVLRAVTKVRMKRGRENVRELLIDPPPHLEGIKIEEFICSAPKVGPVKTSRILRDAGIRPTERLGKISLTDRCFLYVLLPS